MNWKLKAIIQKSISILPFSYRINFLFQRFITVGNELPESFVIDRILHAKNHILSYKKYRNNSISDANILEIGTGWYPIVPIVFLLHGAFKIETTDIYRLFNCKSINQTIVAILKLHARNELRQILPDYHKDLIIKLESSLKKKKLFDKLEILNIKFTKSPSTNYSIDSNSKDFIVSNNTIQCVKKNEILDTNLELLRISRKDALISHFIDLTDVFSYFDKTIGSYNFYRYSDWQWGIISNKSSPHNRLRYSDYKSFYSTFNYNLVEEEIVSGKENELKHLKINKSFFNYSKRDLLVKYVRFIIIINK